jgi:hypothetical protein
MNTNNFKTFVEALEALPASIKSNEVNMKSTKDPACGNVGCFAGLISIVAEDIPELKGLYEANAYDFSEWRHALNMFLQDVLEGLGFEDWAKYYPRVWGNVHGASMYSMYEAFGVEVFYEPGGYGTRPVPLKPLTHYRIIVHIRKAYDRWIALTEKTNGK